MPNGSTIIFTTFVPIIIVTFIAFVILRKVGVMGGGSKKSQAQAAHLQAHGRKARAKIINVQPTGMIVNHINIQCQVTFLLEPLDGGQPFQAQKAMLLNQTQMPRVGDVWPSWIDPADPSSFAVGMPNGASPEQVPVFREFGIPHPLDSMMPPMPGAPGPAGATPPPPPPSHLAELERLAKLRNDGVLTEAEFQREKSKLLGG